jgi:hypothetical protein
MRPALLLLRRQKVLCWPQRLLGRSQKAGTAADGLPQRAHCAHAWLLL